MHLISCLLQRINSAKQQVVAGTNFKLGADVLVNEHLKEYCIEAHRTSDQCSELKVLNLAHVKKLEMFAYSFFQTQCLACIL